MQTVTWRTASVLALAVSSTLFSARASAQDGGAASTTPTPAPQPPAQPQTTATSSTPAAGSEIQVVWPLQDAPASGDYVRVGGLLSLEAVDRGNGNRKHDGFDPETFSLLLTGHVGEGAFLLEVDPIGDDTRYNLREAWFEGPILTHHWVRAGWLRASTGTEFETREEDLPLAGYGFTSWLSGRYGPGVRVDGYPTQQFWWAATLTGEDDSNLAGDEVSGPQFALRAVATPAPAADGSFTGPFGGASFAVADDIDGPLELENPLDQTVINSHPLHGDWRRTIAVEGGWRGDTMRAGAELDRTQLNDVNTPGPGDQTFSSNGAWTVWGACNIAGKAPIWSRGAWQPYALHAGDELPVEVALRYTHADVDGDMFEAGLMPPGLNARNVHAVEASLGAYVSRLTKVSLGWVGTYADHGLNTFGGDRADSSFVMRLDQRF